MAVKKDATTSLMKKWIPIIAISIIIIVTGSFLADILAKLNFDSAFVMHFTLITVGAVAILFYQHYKRKKYGETEDLPNWVKVAIVIFATLVALFVSFYTNLQGRSRLRTVARLLPRILASANTNSPHSAGAERVCGIVDFQSTITVNKNAS